ncbi:MAG: rod shape-determining protein RodA [Streptosporangiales bacterium]|nr:rod shape-determining protein RodA [Streptosporangiales bacterium]
MDWTMLLAVIGLSVLGALLVWSATRVELLNGGADPQSYLKRHLLNTGIGFVLAFLVSLGDYRALRAYAPILYVVTCAGLVAVLTPLGKTINGSHSWIVLGGLQAQPSEFAKVGLVAVWAMLLGELRDAEDRPRGRDILLALGVALLPTALVMLQPDLGTAMVFAAVILGMIVVSGARLRWVAGLVLSGVILIVVAVKLGVLESYQVQRFTVFTNPGSDLRGAGYNAHQAQIAVGSGGFFGKGLFQGEQTNGQFVPEQHTDFIFTVSGEELGFLGSAAIIVLLGVVLWRALRIATTSRDMFGTLLAGGIVSWLSFQAFQNIAMTLGLVPITGLPLPFVSYGGSATFANMAAIGLLQMVHLRHQALDYD